MPSGLKLLGISMPLAFAAAWMLAPGAFRPDPTGAFRRPAAVDDGRSDAAHDPVWALGQRLFFETRLSASSTMSCSSCHLPSEGWTDHLPKAVGVAGKPLAFRAPTLLNAGHIERYGWAGRFPDIEAVAFFAMSSPLNMNVPAAILLSRLSQDQTYTAQFKAAFPDGAISKHNVGTALSRFVRSITSDVAPFDRFEAGDRTAISDSAARGFALFTGKAQCAECHSGWTFTDGSYHDIGIGQGKDVGRGAFFKSSVKLRYAFKTPTLRNIAARAPYMHDGSLATLEAVVDHYDKGGIDRPSRAEHIRPLHLSAQEKADLIAFLRTLGGGTKFEEPASDGS